MTGFIVLAACGSSSDGPDSAKPTPTDATTSGALLEACSIVTAADAEELFGVPVTSAENVAGCGFDATVSPVRRLLVNDITAEGTSDDALRKSAETFSQGAGPAEALGGVGERAFATTRSIVFLKSGHAILVYAGSSQTSPDKAKFIALAARIANRIA